MLVPKTEPDMYQQEHPIESEELILVKLDELEAELDKIDEKEKATYLQALEKCPELVTRKEKLQFLRCEVFNSDLAAKRMTAYWDKRLEIFGPDSAFLPLTLTSGGAMNEEGDLAALKVGFMRLLPEKADPGDRNTVFADPSLQDKTKYSTINMARAIWYLIHVALEDEDSQRKGIVIITYPHRAKIGQFDRELMKTVLGSIRGCLPMRLSAMHLCHPPAFFQAIFPFIKLLMGERLRKRINIHFGSQEHVLHRLETKFGLHREKLPTDLGGSIALDHEKWIEDRRALEKESS